MLLPDSLLAAAVAFTFVSSSAAQSNVAMYWGNGYNQKTLRTFCKESSVDIIPIGFVNFFPKQGNGLLGENFGNACWGDPLYNGPGSNPANNKLPQRCIDLQEDIPYCQSLGKKIILSLGGHSDKPNQPGVPTYSLSGAQDGIELAEQLWNFYGPYNKTYVAAGGIRPLDRGYYNTDTSPYYQIDIDGFDFDIEYKSADNQAGYIACIQALRAKFAGQTKKKYLITGAPQCPLPEANMGEMIQKAQFDALFIQFYNNGGYGCTARSWANANPKPVTPATQNLKNTNFNFNNWKSTVNAAGSKSSGASLYIGLMASPSAGTPADYLTSAEVKNLIGAYCTDKQFGGVMLWEATAALENNAPELMGKKYYDIVKQAMLTCNPKPASISSTVTSTTTKKSSTTTTSKATSSTSSKPSTTSTPKRITTSTTKSITTSTSKSTSKASTSTRSSSPTRISTAISRSSSSLSPSSRSGTTRTSSSTTKLSTSSSIKSTGPTTTSRTILASPPPSSTSSSTSTLSTTSESSSAISSSSNGVVTSSSSHLTSPSSSQLISRNGTSSSSNSYLSSSTSSLIISAPYSNLTSTKHFGTTYTPSPASQSTPSLPTTTKVTTSSTSNVEYITSQPMTTSTIYATSVETITKCPPSITNCPLGQLTTKIISLYTTVCPVSETSKASLPTTSPSNPSFTTSVVYTTRIETVTKCPLSITNCPVGQIVTKTIPLYTTICPVSEEMPRPTQSNIPSGPASSNAPIPSESFAVPSETVEQSTTTIQVYNNFSTHRSVDIIKSTQSVVPVPKETEIVAPYPTSASSSGKPVASPGGVNQGTGVTNPNYSSVTQSVSGENSSSSPESFTGGARSLKGDTGMILGATIAILALVV